MFSIQRKNFFCFEKGWNRQNHSSSGSLHAVKKFSLVKCLIPPNLVEGGVPPTLTAIWKTLIYKTLWLFFVDGMQLPQGYTELLWGVSLLFTRNSWYSLNQNLKNERLRWPGSHLVVLNLCINLVVTKYKLKSIYVKLTQFWPLTVNWRSNYYAIEVF